MSKKVLWKYWGFTAMDNKAAQVWLNDMAAKGWALETVLLRRFAKFVPAEEPVEYFVDWSDAMMSEREDYLALCQEAGWTRVIKVHYLNVFRARPGTTPIQTEPAEEYRRFKTEVVKRECKMLLFYALYFALLLSPFLLMRSDGMGVLISLLARPPYLYLMAAAPALLGAWLFHTGKLFVLWRSWRESARMGTPLPLPSHSFIRLGRAVVLVRDSWVVLCGLLLDVLRVAPWGKGTRPMLFFMALLSVIPDIWVQRDNDLGVWEAERKPSMGTIAKVVVVTLALETALQMLLAPVVGGILPSSEPVWSNIAGYGAQREMSPLVTEVRWNGSTICNYTEEVRWNCVSEGLADFIAARFADEMEPVAGYTDTWRVTGRGPMAASGLYYSRMEQDVEFRAFVVRRGTWLARVKVYLDGDPLPEGWENSILSGVTEQMDTIPG